MVGGYINAHGTSTRYNDKFETLAFKKVLGEEVAKQVGTKRAVYIDCSPSVSDRLGEEERVRGDVNLFGAWSSCSSVYTCLPFSFYSDFFYFIEATLLPSFSPRCTSVRPSR